MIRFLLLSLLIFSLSCKSKDVIHSLTDSSCPNPTSLSASIISESSILLRWGNICDQTTGYIIERKGKKDWETLVEQDRDAIFYFDENLDLLNIKYQYRIKILTNDGSGPYSKILTVPDFPADMNEDYPFIISYPKGYRSLEQESFPLMIFLHGAGERGKDLSMLEVHGPPKKVMEGHSFPCIVVSPQCPENVYWQVNRLEKTLSKILAENNIDKNRIYLTGLSMGGYGTWNWASAHPETFAAIAPICGGGNPELAPSIAHLPIWAFHGAKDNVVPLSESQNMIDALQRAGAVAKFTIYPDANHDSWTETYNNLEFYNWLFSKKKE